jgi:hypothetical protein
VDNADYRGALLLIRRFVLRCILRAWDTAIGYLCRVCRVAQFLPSHVLPEIEVIHLPNKPDAANLAIASELQAGRHWRAPLRRDVQALLAAIL